MSPTPKKEERISENTEQNPLIRGLKILDNSFKIFFDAGNMFPLSYKLGICVLLLPMILFTLFSLLFVLPPMLFMMFVAYSIYVQNVYKAASDVNEAVGFLFGYSVTDATSSLGDLSQKGFNQASDFVKNVDGKAALENAKSVGGAFYGKVSEYADQSIHSGFEAVSKFFSTYKTQEKSSVGTPKVPRSEKNE